MKLKGLLGNNLCVTDKLDTFTKKKKKVIDIWYACNTNKLNLLRSLNANGKLMLCTRAHKVQNLLYERIKLVTAMYVFVRGVVTFFCGSVFVLCTFFYAMTSMSHKCIVNIVEYLINYIRKPKLKFQIKTKTKNLKQNRIPKKSNRYVKENNNNR